MSDKKPIGLVANTSKPDAASFARLLVGKIQPLGLDVSLESATARLLGTPESGQPLSILADRCRLLVVLGGDGTLLHVVGGLCDRVIPVLGINLGSLGFLTSATVAQLDEVVDALARDRFAVSNRSMLDVSVVRGGQPIVHCTALNDAVVTRREASRLVKLDIRIDNLPFTQYNADGLIVATPTGSTAYALSAGGPIMAPEAAGLLLTPICPHVLTNRSVVLADSSRIEILSADNTEPLALTIDGRKAHDLIPADTVVVTKSPHTLKLLHLEDISFADLLQAKLKWSGTNV